MDIFALTRDSGAESADGAPAPRGPDPLTLASTFAVGEEAAPAPARYARFRAARGAERAARRGPAPARAGRIGAGGCGGPHAGGGALLPRAARWTPTMCGWSSAPTTPPADRSSGAASPASGARSPTPRSNRRRISSARSCSTAAATRSTGATPGRRAAPSTSRRSLRAPPTPSATGCGSPRMSRGPSPSPPRLHYRKFDWWHTQWTFRGQLGEGEFAPGYDDRAVRFRRRGDARGPDRRDGLRLGPARRRRRAAADARTAAGGRTPARAPLQTTYGIGMLLQGDLRAAEAAFSTAARLAPEYPDAPVNIARVRLREGDPEGALEALEAALALAPGLPRALFFRAMALKALGRYDEALADLRAVQEVHPPRPRGEQPGRPPALPEARLRPGPSPRSSRRSRSTPRISKPTTT